MRAAAATLLGILVSSSVRAAVPPDSATVRLGVTQVGSAWGNDTDSEVRVFLSVRKPTQCELSRPEYWGAPDSKPRAIVSGLVVTVGGDSVSTPYSAYGDLSDPAFISVACRDADFTITIRGGDAAGAYVARVQVKGMRVNKRRVESGVFPREVWEETTYAYFPPRMDWR